MCASEGHRKPMLPLRQQVVRLVAYPVGAIRAADFETVTEPMPVQAPGEVLIRNHAFLVAPSIKPLLSPDAAPEPGVPYPPVRVGDIPGAATLGEVCAGALPAGTLVLHFRGWCEYTALPVDACQPVVSALDPLWQLGHGWTAYAALTRGAKVRPGDVVFVGSAGGAIGSMAGQIARLLGASRVVGSTSTRAKAERIRRELGYDAVIARSAGDFAEQLALVAPEGLDIVIDTVGGAQLEATLSHARNSARFALMGTLQQDLGTATELIGFDSYRFLANRVTMKAYSADDDVASIPEWEERALRWQAAGGLRFPHAKVIGISEAPRALADASAGCFLGAVIVSIHE